MAMKENLALSNEESQIDVGPRPAEDIAGTVLRFLKDNPFLATVALFGFVALRVLAITQLDLQMALAVFSTVGIPIVVVNSLLSSIGWVAVGFLPVLLSRPINRNRRLMIGCCIALAICMVVLAPLGFVILVPIIAVIFRLMRRSGRLVSFALRGLLYLYILLGVVALFANPRVWLPAERIKLKEPPNATIVGYVLNEQGGWFSVLTEEQRNVVRVKAGDFEKRTVCDPESGDDELLDSSIPQLLRGIDNVDRC